MKKILILLAGVSLFISCSGMKKLQKNPALTTDPTSLTLEVEDANNPMVDVNFQLHVPKKYVPKRATLVYQPQFITTENIANLTPVIISGKKAAKLERKLVKKGAKKGITELYPNGIHVMGDKKPVTVDYAVTTAVNDWMPASELVAWTIISDKKGKEIIVHRQLLATEIMMPEVPAPVEKKKITTQKDEQEEIVSTVYFVINESKFNPNLDENQKNSAALKDLLSKIESDNSLTLSTIKVVGSASPDGTAKLNDKLAQSRANTIANMIETECSVSPTKLDISSVGADWNGFKEAIESSSIPNKSAILAIVNGGGTDWEKSLKLRRLSTFNAIKENILPKLRNVTCQIHYTKKVTVVEEVDM